MFVIYSLIFFFIFWVLLRGKQIEYIMLFFFSSFWFLSPLCYLFLFFFLTVMWFSSSKFVFYNQIYLKKNYSILTYIFHAVFLFFQVCFYRYRIMRKRPKV
ncbi:hypothetical protein HanRHA438_Chr16g0749141 [Helianthus annuus]|nr:hypothetical protein HanIR_Chr16g0800981 [Helianthus annuus]KAJ0834918.1 hypothetical protein HanRHA438_Chr16g0749141 [Helianthus annuus]